MKTTFLQPMTQAQCPQAGRIGSATIRTTERRLATALQHRIALPPSFDLRQFQRNTALLTAVSATAWRR